MVVDCNKVLEIDSIEKSKVAAPLVSIITPLYNAKDFIKDTAVSVLTQTLTDFEWIIINDCSTDNSLEIVSQIAEDDKRIKIISLESNSGPIAARNSGLKIAKGQYIAFIDSDDLWLPNKLEEQIKLIKTTNAPLCYTYYKKINANGELKNNRLMKVPETVSYLDSLKSHSIVASSALYNTSITGKILQSSKAPIGKDDYDFFLFILKTYGKAVAVKKELVHLRVYGDSLTGNKFLAAKNQWYFYKRHLKLNFLKSLFLFSNYAIKGFIKYIS